MHTGIQALRHAYRHTGIQALRHAGIQALRHTCIRSYGYKDVQAYAYRHAGIQAYKTYNLYMKKKSFVIAHACTIQARADKR